MRSFKTSRRLEVNRKGDNPLYNIVGTVSQTVRSGTGPYKKEAHSNIVWETDPTKKRRTQIVFGEWTLQKKRFTKT
jgi:hypothetical protein